MEVFDMVDRDAAGPSGCELVAACHRFISDSGRAWPYLWVV